MSHLSLPFAFRRALLSAIVISAATVTACGRGDETRREDTGGPGPGPGPVLAACNPPWTGRIDSVPRDSILRWAAQLSFTTAEATRGRLYGFPEGAAIGLTEGRAPSGLCWPRAGGCIIARLTTSAAQADLRIPAGTSYVWADSAGGSARTLIIPTDAAAPVVVHGLGHHPVAIGDSLPARVPGPGVCMYCGDTCWCYFPMIGATSAPSILRLPEDTGLLRGGPRRP